MGEEIPPVRDEGLAAVHLGFHHGMGGVQLALSALLLSRVPAARALRGYLSLMLAYGLANARAGRLERAALEARHGRPSPRERPAAGALPRLACDPRRRRCDLRVLVPACASAIIAGWTARGWSSSASASTRGPTRSTRCSRSRATTAAAASGRSSGSKASPIRSLPHAPSGRSCTTWARSRAGTPLLDEALSLAERLAEDAASGRVDLADLGRRARKLLESSSTAGDRTSCSEARRATSSPGASTRSRPS